MIAEAQKLHAVIIRIVDQRRSETRINPTWVATEAMTVLDPEKISPELVYLGCHLELRQIARGVLRDLFEPEDEEDVSGGRQHQHELFPQLQWRYPEPRGKGAKRTEEPNYVLRDEMSDPCIDFNVARLDRESRAKFAHARSLEAFKQWRRTMGSDSHAPQRQFEDA